MKVYKIQANKLLYDMVRTRAIRLGMLNHIVAVDQDVTDGELKEWIDESIAAVHAMQDVLTAVSRYVTTGVGPTGVKEKHSVEANNKVPGSPLSLSRGV